MATELLQELEKTILEVINNNKIMKTLLSATEKMQIAQKIAANLTQDPSIRLEKDDLKNNNVRKALEVACLTHACQKDNPSFKFDYKLLFKSQDGLEEDKDFEKGLKSIFSEMLKLKPKKGKKLTEEEEEELLNNLVKTLSEKLIPRKDKNNLVAHDQKALNLLLGCFDALRRESNERRTLYGVDTHNPGEEFIAVQGVQAGNQAAAQDLAQTGTNFMAEYDKADGGEPDPLGVKMSSIVNLLSDGQMTDFEVELQREGIIPGGYKSPTLKPPGSLD